MLPLSGKPALIILGREVPLGSGYADLIGLEATGQAVIIEIKLAKNPDARRAVVAQILAYAACLHGTTREQFENLVSENLRNRDHESLIDAVRSLQEETSEAKEFLEALDSHLQQGRFRLVFVLDDVPTELIRLVAYLEHVTDKLVIDLVAINSFQQTIPFLQQSQVAISSSTSDRTRTLAKLPVLRMNSTQAEVSAKIVDSVWYAFFLSHRPNQTLPSLELPPSSSALWLPCVMQN